MKLEFFNNENFKSVKNSISLLIDRNSKKDPGQISALDTMFSDDRQKVFKSSTDVGDYIIGFREHDISYYSRVMMDTGIW